MLTPGRRIADLMRIGVYGTGGVGGYFGGRLAGAVVRLARKAGVPVPANEFLDRSLRARS
jgi:ketopantoate reductase